MSVIKHMHISHCHYCLYSRTDVHQFESGICTVCGVEQTMGTGIEEMRNEGNSSLFTPHSSLSGWYDLQGRRLDGKPAQKGIYIYNGKLKMLTKKEK
ncbi:MAG: hypothetical protein IKH01_07025 [Prevotella sp.]|nr:hypothetical protein [Prevotella sp.]MBR3079549.1 hypothetical protein [Prevotella sp.]MBR6190364.1 hypothetical protein [Prevotella sp.]